MARTYTVQSGDTLYEIARRFGTSVERLAQINNITNPELIYPGQVLTIPDAAGPTAPPETGGTAGTGAGASDEATTAANRATRVVRGLQYTIFTDKSTYRLGEEVLITLIKTNITRSPITLRYSTAQRFDFIIRRSQTGREVWRWSRGRSFAQVTSQVILRPGESQVFRARWDQTNNQGRLVEPGTFIIEGYNVAVGYEGVAVSTTVRVRAVGPTPTPTPRPTPTPTPVPTPCPNVNILTNPGFENWPNPTLPPAGWTGSNLFRSTQARTGRYAAGLGAVPNATAVLSQRVGIEPGRVYELAWYARESIVLGGVDRFVLFVEIFYFDRNGNFVGRTEPRYSQDNIPENRFQRYSLSTGRVPAGARTAEVRFTLEPSANNNNTVLIDEVELRCRF